MKTGLRILTVEDETAVAKLLALVLCGPKCKVIGVGDGVGALEKKLLAPQPNRARKESFRISPATKRRFCA